MLGLLTWPVYGSRLPAVGHGRIGEDQEHPLCPAVEDRVGPPARPWPAVRLDLQQHQVLLGDLARVAALRGFTVHLATMAPDHVHVLLSCPQAESVPRLVQLIKGALSRALSVAADASRDPTRGDAPTLPHRKWWARQYDFVRIADQAALERILPRLAGHASDPACTVRWLSPPDAG